MDLTSTEPRVAARCPDNGTLQLAEKGGDFSVGPAWGNPGRDRLLLPLPTARADDAFLEERATVGDKFCQLRGSVVADGCFTTNRERAFDKVLLPEVGQTGYVVDAVFASR